METLFYRNGRLVALAILMILSAGLSALLSLGRQEDPTITNIYGNIIALYPGADPARVEALVTEKIEEKLKPIEQIKEITSVSRTGVSLIRIELEWWTTGAAIEQTWSEVRDAISDAARIFPEGAQEPEFFDTRSSAVSAIGAIIPAGSNPANPAISRRYANMLRDSLLDLPGTRAVETYGAREEEIRVAINQQELFALGMSIADVAGAISEADTKLRAGFIRGAGNDLIIEVAGEIRSLERVRAIPVRRGSDGQIVRVSDVASVERSVREPANSIAYADGKRAILLSVKAEHGARIDAWLARVKSVMKDFADQLPSGLEFRLRFDQSRYTNKRLLDVLVNLLIGTGLVVAVLFVTLGWRAALVVATILPLASLMSLAGLQAVGIPIHQMSVTGLIVALGLLVDAGIVMVDGIDRNLAAGTKRHEAVAQSVRRLAVPLFASTATTALAFMPMVLLPGPAGDFVGAVAVAVIIMLGSSLFLALTITPALAGWFLHPSPAGKGARSAARTTPFAALSDRLEKALGFSMEYPRVAILGALVLPAIGFAAFPTLKAQFFPSVDRNQLHVQVKLAGGASIAETERTALEMDRMMRDFGAITRVDWVIGESAPAFYYNMLATQDGVPSYAEALVTTTSPAATEDILPGLQRFFDRSIPQARVSVRGLVQGPPVDAPVEIRVVGPNVETLRTIGDRVRAIMTSIPEITQVKTQLTGGAPKLVLEFDEDKVRLAGLELAAVARQLETSLEGATGGSLVEASEELPVRIRIRDRFRSQVDTLRRIRVVSASPAEAAGRTADIPLAALGSVDLEPAASPIYRRNGERINTIQGFTHRNVLPEEALKKAQAQTAKSGLVLPPGYRFEIGGDADARKEVLSNLLAAAGIIISLAIATIVLTFNSFRLSVITGIVAVLSTGLSLLALAVYDYPFGILAIIGVIGSIGVSINAAIIILTALQSDVQAMKGERRAIVRTVVAQSRHIVSTTVTTFGGFLPLIVAGGGFWPPFAVAIAGGVLLSTAVSFFFVPPAFLLATTVKLAR